MVFARLADGTAVDRVALRGGRLEVGVLSYGALIQSLAVDGFPVVLGFDAFAPYLRNPAYLGVIAGRCANRIARGRFRLDGAAHALPCNDADNHLHGGDGGFSTRLWAVGEVEEHAVTLTLDSAAGDQGYPGRVRVSCRYEIRADATLRITLTGETDAPTLLNLAAHSYFNLDGSPDVLGHRLSVAADSYLPVDAQAIPTGEIRAVAGSPFDFRRPRRLAGDGPRPALDHNFCLAAAPSPAPRPAARLEAADGSLALDIATTEPGLQVYDGAKLDVAGPGGRRYGAHAGLCLEPQRWPDAINHPGFAGAVLRPGETYRQITDYVFSGAPSRRRHLNGTP